MVGSNFARMAETLSFLLLFVEFKFSLKLGKTASHSNMLAKFHALGCDRKHCTAVHEIASAKP